MVVEVSGGSLWVQPMKNTKETHVSCIALLRFDGSYSDHIPAKVSDVPEDSSLPQSAAAGSLCELS